MFQKIANHLTLLLPHSPDGGQAHEKELDKLKMAMPDAWEELYANRENIIYNTNPQFSATLFAC
jgi:hypothetical protein